MTKQICFELDDELLDLLVKYGEELRKDAENDDATNEDGSPISFDIDTMINIEIEQTIIEHLNSLRSQLKRNRAR